MKSLTLHLEKILGKMFEILSSSRNVFCSNHLFLLMFWKDLGGDARRCEAMRGDARRCEAMRHLLVVILERRVGGEVRSPPWGQRLVELQDEVFEI